MWKLQPASKEASHECPRDCVRQLSTIYADCKDQGLTDEQIEELDLCPFDRHRMQTLAMEIKGSIVERCLRCGCWRW